MIKNTDKIFEDVLDDEFINIFKPIFYFLSLFGMRGVTIEYKFVTSPTVFYKTYSCIIWAVNFVCVLNCVIRCNTRFDALSTDMPLKAGILINGCINTFLAWKSVFYRGHINSQLYVKLQRIERVLKIKNSKQINRNLSKITAIAAVSVLLAFGAFSFMFNLYIIEGFCPTATIGCAVSSMSYFEMFLVMTMLLFLIQRAHYVNDRLSQNGDYFQKEKIYFTSNSIFLPKERVSDEVLQGMCCILDCFADVMDIFQHAVRKPCK